VYKRQASNPDHFRGLRTQAVEAGIPFFFSQWGNWAPLDALDSKAASKVLISRVQRGMCRLDKRLTGRRLDGRMWNQTPKNDPVR
jgi:protein gp37